jgi:secretion-regulating guanine nucleotide exchange factor
MEEVKNVDFFALLFKFFPVPGVTDVYSVACGQQHTVVMTCNGRIFVWGNNKHGQLGVDPSLHSAIFSPTEIFFPQRPDTGCILLSGWTHTAVLTGACTKLV